MLKYAYALGTHQALLFLGLDKFAAMLPPPTALAQQIGSQAGREGVQTALTSIAGGLASKERTPLMQHIRAMGAPQEGESITSHFFRNKLLSQADPEELLAQAALPSAGRSGGVLTKSRVTTPGSTAPTMAPSAQGIGSTAPTMAPSAQGIGSTAPTMAPSAQGISSTAPTMAPSARGVSSTTPTMAPSARVVDSLRPTVL